MPLFDPAPSVDGFAPWFVGSVDRLMRAAVANGVTLGAAVVVGHGGRIVLAKGWGRTDGARGAPAATDQTVWDLASVTKIAATTVAAMLLVQDGRLDLDAPLHRHLPGWPSVGDRSRITVRDLLRHTSGLPPAAPVGRGGREELILRLASMLLRAGPGEQERYGNLDMVLLGAVIEGVADEPLDALVTRRVYSHLGMAETTLRPFSSGIPLDRIAPTERTARGLTHGVVHHPIARDLGGVAGNAGLFASARDLATLASALLWEVPDRLVCRTVVRQFTQPAWGSRFALGWETAAAGTMWGELFTHFAFGHVGYTGTSLWIDPELDVFVVLLHQPRQSERPEPEVSGPALEAARCSPARARGRGTRSVRRPSGAPRRLPRRAGGGGDPPVAAGALAPLAKRHRSRRRRPDPRLMA